MPLTGQLAASPTFKRAKRVTDTDAPSALFTAAIASWTNRPSNQLGFTVSHDWFDGWSAAAPL